MGERNTRKSAPRSPRGMRSLRWLLVHPGGSFPTLVGPGSPGGIYLGHGSFGTWCPRRCPRSRQDVGRWTEDGHGSFEEEKEKVTKHMRQIKTDHMREVTSWFW